MDVKVYDTTNPNKKPFDMSEKGFEKLSLQFPGKFAIFQQITTTEKKSEPQIVVVEKIEKDVRRLSSEVSKGMDEMMMLSKTKKRGNSKPKK